MYSTRGFRQHIANFFNNSYVFTDFGGNIGYVGVPREQLIKMNTKKLSRGGALNRNIVHDYAQSLVSEVTVESKKHKLVW